MSAGSIKENAVQYEMPIVGRPTDAAAGYIARVFEDAMRCPGRIRHDPDLRFEVGAILAFHQHRDLAPVAREFNRS